MKDNSLSEIEFGNDPVIITDNRISKIIVMNSTLISLLAKLHPTK